MTKQYKYIEYEKLNDAVRDWCLGEKVFTNPHEGCWHEIIPKELAKKETIEVTFSSLDKYAKRVEVKENNKLADLLRNIEDDLYHICTFNTDIKSRTLVPLRNYMRENGIAQKI